MVENIGAMDLKLQFMGVRATIGGEVAIAEQIVLDVEGIESKKVFTLIETLLALLGFERFVAIRAILSPE